MIYRYLTAAFFLISFQLTAQILPDSRTSDWSSAGVQGGIPDYPVGVNVLDHGAVGDGSADDTRAIQDAVAACDFGEAVYFPEGTYRTTSTLSLGKSVVLRGEARNRSMLIFNHGGRGLNVAADYAGLEDIHIHTDWTFSDYSGYKIVFQGANNSWLKNVETSGYVGFTVRLSGASHCEVRDSYFHNSQGETSSVHPFRSYGVEINNGDAAYNLIENNIFDWFRHAMILQYDAQDNVYAYNFSWNNWTSDGGASASTDMEFHHGGTSIYTTLVEGNQFEQASTQHHNLNTFLRNRVTNGGVDIGTRNNLVGNEFTEKKHPGTYLGNRINGVETDNIIHGNYITDGSGLQWDAGIADHNIPPSYYISSRPPWFGDLDWPAYGGDLMPGNRRRIPAEVRYWTLLYPEIPPGDLTVGSLSETEHQMSWVNNSSNPVDFIVVRSRDGAAFYRIGSTTETSYIDTTAQAGVDYVYYVRARNHLGGESGEDLGGESGPSNLVSTGPITGIPSGKNDWPAVFPSTLNAGKDIRLNAKQAGQLALRDLTGRLLFSRTFRKGPNKFKSSLQSGVYLMEVTTEGHRLFKRFAVY